MTRFRDEVARLTLPQVRAMFTPREFKALGEVPVTCGGQVYVVGIIREPMKGPFGGSRTWLRCTCGRKTSVVVISAFEGLGCRRCLKLRTRSSGMWPPAPHARPVAVGGDLT